MTPHFCQSKCIPIKFPHFQQFRFFIRLGSSPRPQFRANKPNLWIEHHISFLSNCILLNFVKMHHHIDFCDTFCDITLYHVYMNCKLSKTFCKRKVVSLNIASIWSNKHFHRTQKQWNIYFLNFNVSTIYKYNKCANKKYV